MAVSCPRLIYPGVDQDNGRFCVPDYPPGIPNRVANCAVPMPFTKADPYYMFCQQCAPGYGLGLRYNDAKFDKGCGLGFRARTQSCDRVCLCSQVPGCMADRQQQLQKCMQVCIFNFGPNQNQCTQECNAVYQGDVQKFNNDFDIADTRNGHGPYFCPTAGMHTDALELQVALEEIQDLEAATRVK